MAQPPRGLEELVAAARQLHLAMEGMSDALRAAAVSELGRRLRQGAMPARLAMMEAALAPVRDRFDEADWRRRRDVVPQQRPGPRPGPRGPRPPAGHDARPR